MHVSSTALGPAYSTGSDCWLTGRMCEQMENMSCGDKDIHGRCRDEQLQPRTVGGIYSGAESTAEQSASQHRRGIPNQPHKHACSVSKFCVTAESFHPCMRGGAADLQTWLL